MDDNVGRRSPRSLSPERRGSMLPQSDHSRDPAGEEFLYHLFRGSELLQDSRVHEAKEELEQALLLQPRDPKGQDLLAVVYFRIGHYPRAIQIYEQLKRDHPGRTSLSLNLALCYLKTGQAQPAREELEEVVRVAPEHRRAWGYLGLAYERLADFDKAELAFERGGHAAMARRMMQRRGGRPSIVSLSPGSTTYTPDDEPAIAIDPGASVTEIPEGPKLSERPILMGSLPAAADMRAAVAEVFEELDAGEISFALAQETRPLEPEMWHPVEIGEVITRSNKPLASPAPAPVLSPAPSPPPRPDLLPLAELLSSALLDPPPDRPVSTGSKGQIVLRLQSGGEKRDFAARFDALRSYTGTLSATVLERRGRGVRDSFGGLSGTVMHLSGDGIVVLAPRPGRTAIATTLRDGDVLFLREDAVLAFDLTMTFENGRLPHGDEEPVSVAQVRGPGPVVFETIEPLCTLEVTPAHAATVRSPQVLGWTGRLVPEAIPIGEAPGGQRGLVSFAGEGTVLVAGR